MKPYLEGGLESKLKYISSLNKALKRAHIARRSRWKMR